MTALGHLTHEAMLAFYRERLEGVHKVAVLLSAGIDSHAVLFALLELGKEVACYTFTMDFRVSKEVVVASQTCKTLGLPHTVIRLPSAMPVVRSACVRMAAELRSQRPVEFICVYAMLNTIPQVAEADICTGSAAEGLFGTSRHHTLACARDTDPDQLDGIRALYFLRKNFNQLETVDQIAAWHGKRMHNVFASKGLQELYYGRTWSELNKPHIKGPIWEAFPDMFARVHTRPPANMHLGDSGLKETFLKLLDDESLNPGRRWKSLTPLFKRLHDSVPTGRTA